MQQLKDFFKNNARATAIIAIITALGSLLLDFRASSHIEYQDLINEFRIEVNRLREVEASCNKAFLKHSREISDLQNKLIMLESATMDSPLPMWLKAIGTIERPGIMLVVNKAYEDRFLIPRGKKAIDYIGKTDQEFWGEQLGNSYWAVDLEVITSGKRVDSSTPNPIYPGKQLRTIQYPRHYRDQIIGVAGIAIPDKL